MKVYTISDRQLREFAHLIGDEARRPLLEFIRHLMREMQAAAEEMAALRNDAIGHEDAPPIAPRD